MLSLSRKRAYGAAAAGAALTVGTTAGAAEFYYQPVIQVASQYNTNVNLDPTTKQSAVGYYTDALTNIGISTPRSDTTLQPRLVYNYYPSIKRRDVLEAFLNLNTRYAWQRDRVALNGLYDHRDDVNAEQPGAAQNPVNPGAGDNTATSGQTALGVRRDYLILNPSYQHLLTPLSSVGLSGQFQRMSYNVEDQSGHIGFDYYQARAFYGQNINERLDFSVGAIGSSYNATSINAHATTEGVSLTSGYDWTPVLHSQLTAEVVHVKFDELSPKQIQSTGNAWASTFTTTYKEQISSYRILIGRTIFPSTAGGLFTIDQVLGQYDRDLTQRLHFLGALRYFREETTIGARGNDRRYYASGIVRMQYMMTQTIYVAGYVQHNYQKYSVQPNSAGSNMVGIAFGYAGLQRQR
jgi:hypothetical protein